MFPVPTRLPTIGAPGGRNMIEPICTNGGRLFLIPLRKVSEYTVPDILPMPVMAGVQHGQGGGPAPKRRLSFEGIHSAHERQCPESRQRGGHPPLRLGIGPARKLAQSEETGVQAGLPIGAAPSRFVTRAIQSSDLGSRRQLRRRSTLAERSACRQRVGRCCSDRPSLRRADAPSRLSEGAGREG